MGKAIFLLCCAVLSMAPGPALAEFNADDYRPVPQMELGKNPDAYAGRKVRVEDTFQFCGSDFCVDLHKKNINTRDYYCFAIGPLCVVRMYIKRNHPDAQQLTGLRKGDRLKVFGTFDQLGSDYRFILVDRLIVEKGAP